MTPAKHEQLWKVYEATFNLFAADVPELEQTTGLSESQVRSSLKTLAAESLVDAYDVNEAAQGQSRRGQYKHLTWQCNETYDSTNLEGARATFLAAIPAPTNAAGQGDTTAATAAGGSGMSAQEKPTREYTSEQKKVVAKIMKLRGEGNGYPGIAAKLNEQGVPTFGRGQKWYGPVVRHIVIRETGSADASLKLAGTKRPNRDASASKSNEGPQSVASLMAVAPAKARTAPTKGGAVAKTVAKPDPKPSQRKSGKGAKKGGAKK